MFETTLEKIIAVIVILIVTTIVIIGFIQVKTEQNTFNRCQQANVLFWEAAFTELRVVSCKEQTN